MLGTVKTKRIVTDTTTGNKREVEEIAQRKLDEVLKAFDNHCLPQKNVTMEFFKFNNLTKGTSTIY